MNKTISYPLRVGYMFNYLFLKMHQNYRNYVTQKNDAIEKCIIFINLYNLYE